MRTTSLFVALWACLAACVARAADTPESYAVASVLGDKMTVVQHRQSTGSNIDDNMRTNVPLDDDHFDALATRVATNAIRRSQPDAVIEGVALADKAAYDDVDALQSGGPRLDALVTAARAALKRSDTHYLVVIGNARGDTNLRTGNGNIGNGKLTGVGFYVDPFLRMRKSATGERGTGFLATYAYVRVTLVDLRTGAVVRTENAEVSTTNANAGPETTLNPWDSMSADQKVRQLDRILTRAVLRAVPPVLASS